MSTKMTAEKLASGITEQSILDYLSKVEPVYLGMKNASALPDLKAKTLAAAQVFLDNNLA